MAFAQGPADDREILAEDEDLAAVDAPVAGDHAIAGIIPLGSGGVGASHLEHVQLLERAFVEQQIDAFPGGQLSPVVLRVVAGLAAAHGGLLAHLGQFQDIAMHDLNHEGSFLLVRRRVCRGFGLSSAGIPDDVRIMIQIGYLVLKKNNQGDPTANNNKVTHG
ncbi:hypothetical protein DESC_640021 [Desulfosarcina cetonica]|nr:hypothetical protein DESC_640021 [Desulfosarcina cetonica]